jgi:Domain of unknown function (DUF4160)
VNGGGREAAPFFANIGPHGVSPSRLLPVSPTIFRERGFRFFFFSREESRPHVHVYCGNGEAKFWMEPEIELAQNYGLTPSDLRIVRELIEEHEDEINRAWEQHFGR